MKKIWQSIVILMIMLFGINYVKAESYGIYCEYGDVSFLLTADYIDAPLYLDTESDEIKSVIEAAGYPNKPLNDSSEISWLKNLGILVDAGENGLMWSCPSAATFDYKVPSLYKKEYVGDMFIKNIASSSESYTCNYSGKGGNITISHVLNDDKCEWTITYPSGKQNVKTCSEENASGDFLPNSDCDDIYYVPSTNRIKVSLGGDNSTNTNATLSDLCKSTGNAEIQHYCSGACTYKELSCPSETSNAETSYSTASCGGVDDIPAALPILFKNVINIVKIAVPIILIIMGMLDFGKAVTSQDEKGMKESQTRFVKRIIGAVCVFLVITIVQFVFRLINVDDSNNILACIDCFINNDCHKYTVVEAACYQCSSDTDKYIWSTNPGTTSVCSGGYVKVDLSEKECKEKYIEKKCYQCNGSGNVYKWDTSNVADSACPSGYHERSDISAQSACHS